MLYTPIIDDNIIDNGPKINKVNIISKVLIIINLKRYNYYLRAHFCSQSVTTTSMWGMTLKV
jgi:hypothetical protein